MSILDEALRELSIKKEKENPEALIRLLTKKVNGINGYDAISSQLEDLNIEVSAHSMGYSAKIFIGSEAIYFSAAYAVPQLLYFSRDPNLIINGVEFNSPDVLESRCPQKYDPIFINFSKVIKIVVNEDNYNEWIPLLGYYKDHKNENL